MPEAFVYQYVYTLGAVRRVGVYVRKRITVVPNARMVKLLIQSMFTSPDGDLAPVYRQHPYWG